MYWRVGPDVIRTFAIRKFFAFRYRDAIDVAYVLTGGVESCLDGLVDFVGFGHPPRTLLSTTEPSFIGTNHLNAVLL